MWAGGGAWPVNLVGHAIATNGRHMNGDLASYVVNIWTKAPSVAWSPSLAVIRVRPRVGSGCDEGDRSTFH